MEALGVNIVITFRDEVIHESLGIDFILDAFSGS